MHSYWRIDTYIVAPPTINYSRKTEWPCIWKWYFFHLGIQKWYGKLCLPWSSVNENEGAMLHKLNVCCHWNRQARIRTWPPIFRAWKGMISKNGMLAFLRTWHFDWFDSPKGLFSFMEDLVDPVVGIIN